MDEAEKITLAAYEVLGQLFVCGPTWDGNIISKEGRDRCVEAKLVDRLNGWNFLTRIGVDYAATCLIPAQSGDFDLHDKWGDKQKHI